MFDRSAKGEQGRWGAYAKGIDCRGGCFVVGRVDADGVWNGKGREGGEVFADEHG